MSGHGGRLFRVHGLDGHIDVYGDRLEIHRHGVLHLLFEMMHLYEGSTENVIPIKAITAVTMIEPLLFPGYIRFSYAGAPRYSQHYWTDVMAPNTLMMGYFDIRPFHRLKSMLDAAMASPSA